MMNLRYHLLLSLLIISVTAACKRDLVEPDNPFDKIKGKTPTSPADTLQKFSFARIHRDILQPKCAVPGCHDGNFEPDFRTVSGAYSTLVYADIVKNNATEDFRYRVVPGDTASSVLWQRLTRIRFVNENDRMPQDNIGSSLPQADLDAVAGWILNGAQDVHSNTPAKPDTPPVVSFYVAVNESLNFEYSAESNRVDGLIYMPFKLPVGTGNMLVVPLVEDDNTPLSKLQYNRLFLSRNMDNFDGAISIQASYIKTATDSLWVAVVPRAGFQVGETWYMRYQVNDGVNSANTEFPKASSPDYYKSYYSFTIVP